MPLIVGLGNPGGEYDGTPHNAGFAVLDALAVRQGIKFRRSRSGIAMEAIWPRNVKTILLKPQAFMNRSGVPVQMALRWHEIPIGDMLVVCDDVNLPLGYLRLRSGGGAGGQKGLTSIIEALGTNEFSRLRLGVGGGEPGADVARYVLRPFASNVRAAAMAMIERAADAIECYLRDGLETAMNRFNTPRISDESAVDRDRNPGE